MKTSLIAAAALSLMSASAFASELANTYVCQNSNGDAVSFTTTSKQGAPTFSVKKDGNSLALTPPTVADTTLGYQVSAYVADGPTDMTLTYTLIVPNVQIGDTDPQLTVDAMLVASFGGGLVPPSVTYASQSNHFSAVQCTASYGAF